MTETNGPPGAQEYRSRNPQTIPAAAREPLSRKTLVEMQVGRSQIRYTHFNQTMSEKDKAALKQWAEEWVE